MGSNFNFKGFGEVPPGDGSGGKGSGNFGLARQSSVYSLTFDEFQSTIGGLGKDFGSMNMDELLKNIWTAEETQGLVSNLGAGEVSAPAGNLQRQGSLTLPRTLSQKTVDEVWKDLVRVETGDVKYNSVASVANLPQRQQTLGEMTLEEFLMRAGVVREDAQPVIVRPNTGFYGLQQSSQNTGVLGNRIADNNVSVHSQSSTLALNVGAVRPSEQATQQQQPLFPKPENVAFASSMHLGNNAQLSSPRTRGPMTGALEPSMNTGFNKAGGGGFGIVGLGAGAARSPANQISPDLIAKSSGDTSSLSPVPYMLSRGRKSNGGLEKVVERRQRRMIKNRESAARSRARKQAYTLELEAEVAKLKETNEELQRKQTELMEMQKDEILETMKRQWGGKRQCLRRTLTGPW